MITATSQLKQSESTIAQSATDCKTHTIPAAYKGIVDHMARFFAEHPELLAQTTKAQS